jgi:L-threonylcarbamoyladenylate synthase
LEIVKLPLAAPSANPTNKLSPTNLQDAIDAFGTKCPPVIDGGQCEFGIESTVLDLTVQTPTILRFGPITKQQIEDVLEMEINSNSSSPRKKLNQSQKSPGQCSLHYAPETPLYLHSNHMKMLKSEIIDKENIIIIPKDLVPQAEVENDKRLIFLPVSDDSLKTAKVLYSTLHKADKLMCKKIHIALYPSTSQLFSAINDRLTRASTERV